MSSQLDVPSGTIGLSHPREESVEVAGQVVANGREVGYRRDIDGLRAVAVIAVIAFHLDLLPTGYLGVDVFFVISGYLITQIILRELSDDRFAISNFYERRVRRILPLAVTVSSVALVVGAPVMLPDDFENLAQSVVATNLFANNILQAITTKNYWDVVNEYKPLMHTWSLGVEEQFYLFWPLILIVSWRYFRGSIVAIISFLFASSLVLFLLPVPEHLRFYHLPFRFFELASGGLIAIAHQHGARTFKGAQWGFALLLATLIFCGAMPARLQVILAVFATALIMMARADEKGVYSTFLENKFLVFLGLISFSLYMWHQLVFAMARYALVEVLEGAAALAAVAVTLALSICSYFLIERPFRDRRRMGFRRVAVFVAALFFAGTIAGISIHLRGGVIRDVPELELEAGRAVSGVHAKFNHRVHALNREFDTERIRVLVIGDSFARDWVNVLLATPWSGDIEISYSPEFDRNGDIGSRARRADIVFWSELDPDVAARFERQLLEKLFVVGPKNFGRSAGIFYNFRGEDYFLQRVKPDDQWLELNTTLRAAFGARYIDQMTPIMDSLQRVPVFTPDGKFISQDCQHLTRAGAAFMASRLAGRIGEILQESGVRSSASTAIPPVSSN